MSWVTSLQLDKSLFPNLKWKDEPIEVELLPRPKMSVRDALKTMAANAENPDSETYRKAKQDWLEGINKAFEEAWNNVVEKGK